jgi:hypothetical protein
MHRDNDFSSTVTNKLARRAAYFCSNPDCPSPRTIGPAEDPAKVVMLGEACHIKAASPGGARYDPSQTDEERKSITNGIWLCNKCATLIDRDVLRFPVETLHEWKRQHEHKCQEALTKPEPQLESLQKLTAHILSNVRQAVRDELVNYALTTPRETSTNEAEETTISLDKAFLLYSDFVRNGESIKAGRLLLSALVQIYDAGNDFGEVNVLWFFSLPAMPVGLRLVIRAYQIAIRDRLSIPTTDRIRDFWALLDTFEASDSWSIPACLFIACRTPLMTLQVLRKLIEYVREPSAWQIFRDEEANRFYPEVLVLLHTDRFGDVSEFREWLRELAKFPKELFEKSDASSDFATTALWVVDQLWLKEDDKPEKLRDWTRLQGIFADCLAIATKIHIACLTGIVTHALIIIEADYLEQIENARATAEKTLTILSGDDDGAFLVAETLCRQYIYAGDEANLQRWSNIAHSFHPHLFEQQHIRLLIAIAGTPGRTPIESLKLVEEAHTYSMRSTTLTAVSKIRVQGERASALWLCGKKVECIELLGDIWISCLTLSKDEGDGRDCLVAFQQLVNAFTTHEFIRDVLPPQNRLIGHFCKIDDTRAPSFTEGSVIMTEWQLATLQIILGHEEMGCALLFEASESEYDPGNLVSYPLAASATAVSMALGEVVTAIKYSQKMKDAVSALDPNLWPKESREVFEQMRRKGEDGTRGVLFTFWLIGLFRIAITDDKRLSEYFEKTIHRLYSNLEKDEIECVNYAARRLLGKELFPSVNSETLSRRYEETHFAIDCVKGMTDSSKTMHDKLTFSAWVSMWASLNIGELAFPLIYLLVLPVILFWRNEISNRGFAFSSIRLLKEEVAKIETLPTRKKLTSLYQALTLSAGDPQSKPLAEWIKKG